MRGVGFGYWVGRGGVCGREHKSTIVGHKFVWMVLACKFVLSTRSRAAEGGVLLLLYHHPHTIFL